jgi:hypothetical protein
MIDTKKGVLAVKYAGRQVRLPTDLAEETLKDASGTAVMNLVKLPL